MAGVGDDALKDLDERGIIRIGAEVRAGDILVGKVTPKGETELTADEEDNFVVAQANEELDEEGHFLNNNVSGRYRDETSSFPKRTVDLMDVSPKMVFSVATSMVPFLQNDDANRALMGSNMQRQAVPLMITDTPVVSTGIEGKAAVDSGVCQVAKNAGTVVMSSGSEITVRRDDNGQIDRYKPSPTDLPPAAERSAWARTR